MPGKDYQSWSYHCVLSRPGLSLVTCYAPTTATTRLSQNACPNWLALGIRTNHFKCQSTIQWFMSTEWHLQVSFKHSNFVPIATKIAHQCEYHSLGNELISKPNPNADWGKADWTKKDSNWDWMHPVTDLKSKPVTCQLDYSVEH